MPKFLFRNRWLALVWAFGVLISISVFFSEGGGQENLAKAAEDLRGKAEFAEAPGEDAEDAGFAPVDEEVTFADDEPAEAGGKPVKAKLRLGVPQPGGDDSESADDAAETYVILEPNTAIEEDGEF